MATASAAAPRGELIGLTHESAAAGADVLAQAPEV
jgi:hypothetical protein